MAAQFKSFLPDPKDKESSKLSPEVVLNRLQENIDGKYDGRIIGRVTSSATIGNGFHDVLTYTLYLEFTRHDDFSYPLINVECVNSDGSYPIKVLSHYGPPEIHGTVETEEQFEKVIEAILKETRTRNVILSMY